MSFLVSWKNNHCINETFCNFPHHVQELHLLSVDDKTCLYSDTANQYIASAAVSGDMDTIVSSAGNAL